MKIITHRDLQEKMVSLDHVDPRGPEVTMAKMEIKEQLVRSVAASKRPRLKQLLASQQRLDYTRLEELKKGPERS